jgi:transketolase
MIPNHLSSIDAAKIARISALKMTHTSKASHIASCLSVIDILSVAFAYKFERINTDQMDVLLSKGHAAAALYAVLDAFGELNYPLDTYCQDGSPLYGHVNHHANKHIPLSTGSLGHGLPFGMGLALAKKKTNINEPTVVIMSDGECNEGTTWESAMVASHHGLNKLVTIIDRNRIQSLGNTEEILQLEPLIDKWTTFGWSVFEIDGHNHSAIRESLIAESQQPVCIIANTVKGKGVAFMENSVEWHYKSPNAEEIGIAIKMVSDAQ